MIDYNLALEIRRHIRKRVAHTKVTLEKHPIHNGCANLLIENTSIGLDDKIVEMRKIKRFEKALWRLLHYRHDKGL